MSMIRNFLLTLALFLVFGSSTFAYENPRWYNVPISVYIPNTSESADMINAFNTWQSASGGVVRFIFRKSSNLADISDISVNFVNSLNNNSGYTVGFIYPIIKGCSTNFYKARIAIASNNSEGEAYSNAEKYAIMIRAVGDVIGVRNIGNSPKSDSETITKEDLARIKALYRP